MRPWQELALSPGLGLRVLNFGFRVLSFGFEVLGFGFGDEGFAVRIERLFFSRLRLRFRNWG